VSITLARRNSAAFGRVLGAQGLLWPLLAPAFVVVALLRRLCSGDVDPDYWWHLATGRWMLDHGSIPTSDPFSFTHLGQSWYAHEWLGEWLIALADRAGGYALNIAITALILGAGCWLLWRTARGYGAARRTAAFALLGAVLFTAETVAVRPQVWAFALIMALLHELAAHDLGARRRLWHLPLLFVLLININLLAFMAGLVLALYALHRAVVCRQAAGERRADEAARLRQVLIVGGLSALALCVNPRGPALLLFAARTYADAASPYWSQIQEWKPLGPTAFNLGLYATGAAATLLIAYGMWRRKALWPGLPALVFAVMAARAARYVPLFGITAAIGCAWYVAAARRERDLPLLPAPNLGRVATLATLLACALTLAAGRQAQFRRTPDAALDGAYPVAATAFLQQHAAGARIFADYGWGGYLDQTLYPRANVFIDGRAEMFGVDLFKTYLDVAAAKPGWQQTLTTDRVGAVLVQADGPLAAALSGDPGWHLAFHDAHSVLYLPAVR
jgi:hypothetical protein